MGRFADVRVSALEACTTLSRANVTLTRLSATGNAAVASSPNVGSLTMLPAEPGLCGRQVWRHLRWSGLRWRSRRRCPRGI